LIFSSLELIKFLFPSTLAHMIMAYHARGCLTSYHNPILISFISAKHPMGYTQIEFQKSIDISHNQHQNNKKKTRIVSRRLADTHRRQAVQARIKNNTNLWCVAWRQGLSRQAVSGKNPETLKIVKKQHGKIIHCLMASHSYSNTK